MSHLQPHVTILKWWAEHSACVHSFEGSAGSYIAHAASEWIIFSVAGETGVVVGLLGISRHEPSSSMEIYLLDPVGPDVSKSLTGIASRS